PLPLEARPAVGLGREDDQRGRATLAAAPRRLTEVGLGLCALQQARLAVDHDAGRAVSDRERHARPLSQVLHLRGFVTGLDDDVVAVELVAKDGLLRCPVRLPVARTPRRWFFRNSSARTLSSSKVL